MDEIHGIPGRRLSQIVDPITRLASDFGSSSAPCSPRLGARINESCRSTEKGFAVPTSGSDGMRGGRPSAPDSKRLGSECPRLMPRRACQAPVPPPRPRNAKGSSPVLPRDSPYVNVSHLMFRKNENFTQAVRNTGYVELKDTSSSSSTSCASNSCKYSPYDFSSEPSGHMEYVDKSLFRAQPDFSSKCFEVKVSDSQNPNCIRSNYDPEFSDRAEPFERSFSSCSRQYQDGENQLYVDRTSLSSSAAEEKKEPSVTYSASKSFDGFSNTVEDFNWQERCLELQLELHRTRSQATRIRDMLREKVSNI